MPTSSETPAGQSNIAVPIAPIAPKPKTETLADLNRRKEIAEEDIKRITTVLTAATQNHETTTRLKVELRDLGDELDAINRAIADPELAQAVWRRARGRRASRRPRCRNHAAAKHQRRHRQADRQRRSRAKSFSTPRRVS